MGCGRQPRESEKMMRAVWDVMLNLHVCVWHGGTLIADALEEIAVIEQRLKELKEQLKKERNGDEPPTRPKTETKEASQM